MSASASGSFAASHLPKIAWGQGSYVYDTDGKQYIDGSGGPAAFCLGHSHPEVNAAIKAQTYFYKVVYLGFGFEAINDPLDRADAMQAIMDWLNAPDVAAGWVPNETPLTIGRNPFGALTLTWGASRRSSAASRYHGQAIITEAENGMPVAMSFFTPMFTP